MKKFIWRVALAASVGFVLGITSNAYAADKGGQDYLDPTTIAAAPVTKKDLWTGLYVEGGLGLTSSNVDVGMAGVGNLLTLGDTAWSGHLGIGYDYLVSPHVFVGAWARVHMDDLSYSVIGTKLADSQVYYSVGGRVGWVPRSDWALYVLAGYQFANLDTVGAPDIDSNAWLVGGGIEGMLTDHWFIGLEAVAALGESDNTAAGIKGISTEVTDYTGKVRLGFKF